MKKILSFGLLTSMFFVYTVESVFAIEDIKPDKKTKSFFSKKVRQEASILDFINYDWWKKTNDVYLEKYITTAIEKNHDIKIAKLNIEKAKLTVTQTRSAQLPSVSIGASPIVAKMSESTKTMGSFALPIMASYELDLFGKNSNKTKSAKKLMESTIYQTQATDISIAALVGTTYYNIVKFDKLIDIEEKLVKERNDIYNLAKISNKEGITSTSDLMLAEKNLVLAQNDLIDYKKMRQNSLNALAVLIGDSAENTKDYKRISYKELGDDFDIQESVSSEIIVNRPDYKAIEKQLEASGLDIKAAKKEFLPTIDILGILSFVAASGLGSMNWKNSLDLLGANATLPIFTGFQRVANLKLNKNKYEQLLEQYQKTNLVAIQEINDSLYNLKSDNEKYLNNSKAYNIQKEDYNLSKSKYNQGVISKLDLLQQQETLLYVELLKTSSKMDCYIDKIGLYKASGAKI